MPIYTETLEVETQQELSGQVHARIVHLGHGSSTMSPPDATEWGEGSYVCGVWAGYMPVNSGSSLEATCMRCVMWLRTHGYHMDWGRRYRVRKFDWTRIHERPAY